MASRFNSITRERGGHRYANLATLIRLQRLFQIRKKVLTAFINGTKTQRVQLPAVSRYGFWISDPVNAM